MFLLRNLLFSLIFSSYQCVTHAEPLLVAGAASLRDALDEIAVSYKKIDQNAEITYNFGGSGTLQRQIENGAPVDVFIAAADIPMNALEKQDLLRPETRTDLLTNTLVLVSSKDRHDITSLADLTQQKVKHIAIGDPRSVPAGAYTLDFITAENLLPKIEAKLVRFLNVRQALAAVETGNADAGFVYRTDAITSASVHIVATVPPSGHRKIVYPIAITRRSKQPEFAQKYVEFLKSNSARAVFEKHGFITLQHE